MTWTATGGGDHEGADWTPSTSSIGGVHYNIGTFTVANGVTLTINAADIEFEVYADTINVVAGSYIIGTGKGFTSGGPGAGGGSTNTNYGGSGGGHGGAGGGAGFTTPGIANGTTDTTAISMGSAGGVTVDGAAGIGGGAVIFSADTITMAGDITCTGLIPASGNNGGGAGGGVLLIGGDITYSGAVTVNGGPGGNGSAGNNAGGGGGGGRLKILWSSSLTDTGSFTATGGAGGTGPEENGSPGAVGVKSTHEMICDSTYAVGQTFQLHATLNLHLSDIRVWVNTVNTAGFFVFTVYDDVAKSNTLGSKTATIFSTGLNTITLDDPIQVTATEGFLEITTAGAGDIELGIKYNEPYSGYDSYYKSVINEKTAIYLVVYGYQPTVSPVVYNIADTTVKCNVANEMLPGSIYRINTDGTGTIDWDIDFTDESFIVDSVSSGVSHDAGNDELDIADDGYIYWPIDTKYPIIGIPTLLAKIDITAGTPTIQISSDGSTWYDIDTAIVDDVDTEYPLDNAANLSLAGKTSFYFRFDCVKAGAATCSVKSFELDVDIHTIYAKNPKITKGGAASTFRIDQDPASGMNCTVALIFRSRWWA